MNKQLRVLKKIWLLNFLRRTYSASSYFNRKYWQIFKWGFSSKEDTNYTYDLTPSNILYLAKTIAVVTNSDYKEALGYINEIQNDAALKKSIMETIAGSPQKRYADNEVRFGRRLGWYAFARILKPEIIVETGVDKGLGSVVLCAALLRNKQEGYEGRYYGTDINPNAGYFLSGKYKEVGQILYGDSITTLSGFTDNIDLFINDSDHSAEYEYREYQTIKNRITEKTVILGDNSSITDKLAIFSNEAGRDFIYFQEVPSNHWYPGSGIGISFNKYPVTIAASRVYAAENAVLND